MKNLEVPLPRFDDFKPSLASGISVQQQPSMSAGMQGPVPGGINVDGLPSLDDLDFSKPQPMLPSPHEQQ